MKELIDFNLIVIKDGWRTRNLQIMAYTKNYYAGDYVQVCNVAARASIHYCVFGIAWPSGERNKYTMFILNC